LKVVICERYFVYKNVATCWVVKTFEKLHDSALTTSASTHKCNELSRLGTDVDTTQHAVFWSPRICEAYVLQLHFAFKSLDLLAVGGPVIDLGDAVDERLQDLGSVASLTHVGSERKDGAG
jgi:hypothetical protein